MKGTDFSGLKDRLTDLVKAMPERLPNRIRRLSLVLVIAMSLPVLVWLVRQSFPGVMYVDIAGQFRPWTAHAVTADYQVPDGHQPTPKVVKGLYVSADAIGHRGLRAYLTGMAERTEINSLVIDLKNHNSYLAFETDDPLLSPYVSSRPPLGDMRELTDELHGQGLYLIARLFVFQDQLFSARNPEYAVKRGQGLWTDHRGLYWLDAAAKPVWEYNAAIAIAAYEAGFDEIQFDYIRFPSDGDMRSASYPYWDEQKPKSEAIGEFFEYLDLELRQKREIPISVDLFGLTMWEHDYDLNIGQRLDKAVLHFDYVSPMVYPSHYPVGYLGMANPALHPYEIVHKNMLRGQQLLDRLAQENPGLRLGSFRPWLQDFDLGADYGPDRVKAQIRAVYDGGGSDWLLWNAANRYTKAALEPSPAVE